MPGDGRARGMRCCFMPGVAFVPALLVAWSSAAFIVPYVVAVVAGHVDPFVPYISDTGTKPPESGIFCFMINISSILGAATMCIRSVVIEKQNESSRFVSSTCNVLSLCIGLLGCVGMAIVASFQELTVTSVHDVGALVAFGSGVVYITLQSIISYKSCPRWNTHLMCHIRMAISLTSCIAVIPMIVFASQIPMSKIHWIPSEKKTVTTLFFAVTFLENELNTHETKVDLRLDSEDYVYHFVSAICEWIVAFGFIFFFFTFIRDFQRISLRISTEMYEDC